MKLIVGLGNPEPEYHYTRHNIGFVCVDKIADTLFSSESFQPNKKLYSIILKAENILIVKPQTFMNLSGKAVQAIAGYYKIQPSDIWVIHDEVDIELGRVKIQIGGGSAGHNGINSIIEALGNQDFVRWRVGVGKPPKEYTIATADFVLQEFASNEQPIINRAVEIVTDSTIFALKNDVIATMNKYN